MIPYEELCESLARWRTRNGMANGASAAPPAQRISGQRAAPPAPPQRTSAPMAAAPYAPPEYSPSPAAPYAPPPPAAPYAPAPYLPPPVAAFVPATTAPEPPPLFGSSLPEEDRTDLHTSAVAPRAGEISYDAPIEAPSHETTGEIDLDDVLVDEDPI